MDSVVEAALRARLMEALRDAAASRGGYLSRAQLESFEFDGAPWKLLDLSRGIRNLASLETTLTIVHNPDGPYHDKEIAPGIWEYAYQRGREEGTNTKLRRAGELGVPVIFLMKADVKPSAVYVPVSLARVIGDDRSRRMFTVALEEVATAGGSPLTSELERRYAERIVRQRVHQPLFRARVLSAYRVRCAVCTLHHGSLLDAAHIVPDGNEDPPGLPTTPNGLALCKIHHAAYDQNMLGVSPDYRVAINRELLEEVDGPMLKHGLQEMHGRVLTLPERRGDRPDPERLAWRWERFAG